MILSNLQMFSDSQNINSQSTGPTTIVSTNVIDLGAPGTPLGAPTALTRDIGPGTPIEFFVQVVRTFSNLPGTLTVQIYNHTTTSVTSGTKIAETRDYPSSVLAQGDVIPITVMPDQINSRYLGLAYVCTNSIGDGALTAGIAMGVQKNLAAGRPLPG